ncbi:MAG: hypothetical protein LBT48_03070 [Prevotellaceae bacterium]|jgi:hypothetical protein|nr:hypothetical protein [Prevotellaceae bacterium]
MKKIVFLLFIAVAASCGKPAPAQNDTAQSPEKLYDRMQKDIAKGWNTWDTRSVLTHVLLPYGAAIDLNVVDKAGKRANVFLIGERREDAPILRPGAHTYDGYYTDIAAEWHGLKFRVQSAADEWKNVIIITPLAGNAAGGHVVVAPKNLWHCYNRIHTSANKFSIHSIDTVVKLQGVVNGDFIGEKNKEIILSADKPVTITCGVSLSPDEAQAFVQSHADAFVETNKEKFGDHYEVYNAMQNVLSWDNIFDPTVRKVMTPVSRIWNVGWSFTPEMGGFVLFCWDTYFASIMLSVGSKELAYANAVEITRGVTEEGFVPNFYTNHYKSRDRSQPPVGSMAVWHIYQKYKEKWFLELLYDKLLSWNRWWDKARRADGLLCWGSTPFEPSMYCYWELMDVNNTQGGAYESGLDNSHMYDDVPFDNVRHIQKLNDAGLSGLYVMDCDILAKIAAELGRTKEADELRRRGDQYRKNLADLWDDSLGFYYNRHIDTKTLNRRISPTNFYPMLAQAPTQAQAERMVNEHLLNPDEFWGEWVIPTTPRNDPAFHDNAYWRGRIWAPLNFLVYMGLRNYDLPEARKALAGKSKDLLLKSWMSDGYVFENYSAVTGTGDDVGSSDKFYHWGALLSFIALMEEGYF